MSNRRIEDAEALLKEAHEQLSEHMFGGDYGSYNNDGVIVVMEKIDAYFRGDEPLKVGGTE